MKKEEMDEMNKSFNKLNIIFPDKTTMPYPDNDENPFVGIFRKYERHGQLWRNLYGCSFNTFNKFPAKQYGVAVGGPYIHLYHFPTDSPIMDNVWTLNLMEWMTTQQNRAEIQANILADRQEEDKKEQEEKAKARAEQKAREEQARRAEQEARAGTSAEIDDDVVIIEPDVSQLKKNARKSKKSENFDKDLYVFARRSSRHTKRPEKYGVELVEGDIKPNKAIKKEPEDVDDQVEQGEVHEIPPPKTSQKPPTKPKKTSKKPPIEKQEEAPFVERKIVEDLYTVAWCFDDAEPEGKNPYKIVTGGETGHIYVIDVMSREVDNMLTSHSGHVNDIRTCPFNPAMFASASKDQTIRVFHIRNDQCLLIFAGRNYHMDSAISLDWSPNGDYLLSCGFDHKVIKWNLRTQEIHIHLEMALKILRENGRNSVGKIIMRQNNHRGRLSVRIFDPMGCSLLITVADTVIRDLHFDCVDCIRMYQSGDEIYVLSKACGTECAIKQWRLGNINKELKERLNPDDTVNNHYTCQTQMTVKPVEDGQAWFGKFGLDPKNRWLVTGNATGTISFFDLHKPSDSKPVNTIATHPVEKMIRQVSFSDEGRIMMVVGDEGFVARFDRVRKGVNENIWKDI